MAVVGGSLERERGAVGSEYAGILVIAGLLVAVLTGAILVSGVQPKVTAAICSIFSQDCAPAEEPPIDTLLGTCEVASTSGTVSAEGSVFSVNLGVNGTATMAQVRHADGTTSWEVTLSGGGHLGAHAMIGSGADFGLSKRLSADAKAALAASVGSTYSFSSEEEAQRFLEGMATEAGKWAAAKQAGLAEPVVQWILDRRLGTYTPPPASSLWIELGTQGSAEIAASLGLTASLSGGGSNAFGIKMEPGTGDEAPQYTIYYSGTRELAAQFGFGAEGAVETVVSITYQDGEPIAASVEAAGDISGAFFGGGDIGGDVPFGGSTGAPGLGIGVGDTVKGQVALNLDLTDADNMNALADVLQSGGMPLFPTHGTPGYQNPLEAMQNLADRFGQGGPREGATLTAQTFDGATGGIDIGLWAGKILAFGAGAGLELETLHSTGAWFFDPGVGMSQWVRCLE